MKIYKIVFIELGESEIESRLFWDKDAAIKWADEILNDPQIDMVSVYEETSDPDGYFRTTQCIYSIRKED